MESLNITVAPTTPLLLRRAAKIPAQKDQPVTANMTVVTTQGIQPEMRDQTRDQTAPRND